MINNHTAPWFLRVRVVRGIDLALRDRWSDSDPYVILSMGGQKYKTREIMDNLNPVWNQEFTFTVQNSSIPITLKVMDKDVVFDDPMGRAEIDIRPLDDERRKALNKVGVPGAPTIRKVAPDGENYLARESVICGKDGKVVQDIILRLRDVERGELVLQLQSA